MDSTSAPPTRSRTLERTNIPALVPNRLADLDYGVFDELADLEHRGSRVEVERLLSFLGAAIENSAILRGDRPNPTELFESEAVTVTLDALESKYPAWFGNKKALSELDIPVADDHLSKRDLKEAYFGEQLDPETEPVSGTDWTDEKRVLIPLLALVLGRIREQIDADTEAATNSAQQTIKRTIVRESVEHDLDESEVGVAVDAAIQMLGER